MSIKVSEFLFKGVGVPKFESFLDVSAYRHKLIAGNVANVATPGYRSRDIDFQAEFDKLTGQSSRVTGQRTHPAHIPLGQHKFRDPEVEEARVAPDELNSVDIDTEVSKMARNELEYTIAARLLAKKFQGLSRAIKGQ